MDKEVVVITDEEWDSINGNSNRKDSENTEGSGATS